MTAVSNAALQLPKLSLTALLMIAQFQTQPCGITDDRMVSNAALLTEQFQMQLCGITHDSIISNAALQHY